MWTFLKKHAPKRWTPHLKVVSKYVSYFSNSQFYWQLTIFQFFTKTRLGYWFYCAGFIFPLTGVESSFMGIIVLIVLASAMAMAALKGSSKGRGFLEKTIGLKAKFVDNSIKDSPVWIIASALKPALVLIFLTKLIDATESHRVNKLNKFLHDLPNSSYMEKWESSEDKAIAVKVVHDIVDMVTTPSGIEGAFSKLKDGFIIPDYSSFSFFILITLVILLSLEKILERRRKSKR